MRKKTPLWVKIIVPVVLLIAVMAAISAGSEDQDEDQDVEVPDVVGELTSQASTAIEDAGLSPDVTTLARSDDPVGEVFETDPVAGTEVPEGTTISVSVSGGPPEQLEPRYDEPEQPAPAPKPAKPTQEEVHEALSDLSAEDVVDLGIIPVQKFCRAYAQVLSAGLGEDTAYGNFLRGYQQGGFEGGPSAREVFDELVSRC